MSVADEKETDTENAREEDKQILDRDAQPTSVCSAGDMGGRVIDEEESEDEDSSIVGTPHSKVVRKQRYASKLLKRRINNVNEPVAQVFLPEETDWKIHNNSTAETNQKSELSNYRYKQNHLLISHLNRSMKVFDHIFKIFKSFILLMHVQLSHFQETFL